MSNCKALYTLLPVNELEISKKFWISLGFSINENYSDYKSVCIELKKDTCYIFLFSKDYFYQNYQRKEILDQLQKPSNAIQMNSREEVIHLVSKAVLLGAIKTDDTIDHGWLYYDAIVDPDGYQWQILYIDDNVI